MDREVRDASDQTPQPSGGGWTIPVLCAGLALIACCVLVPQADANRRLVFERSRLQADLDNIQKRISLNEQFLQKLGDDPNLAERLAQRQMKLIREGSRELPLDGPMIRAEMSPYYLVDVPAPVVAPPPPSTNKIFAGLSRNPRYQLYATGIGLMLVAVALVAGDSGRSRASS